MAKLCLKKMDSDTLIRTWDAGILFFYILLQCSGKRHGGCSLSLIKHCRELARVCVTTMTGAFRKQGAHITPDHHELRPMPQKTHLFNVQ